MKSCCVAIVITVGIASAQNDDTNFSTFNTSAEPKLTPSIARKTSATPEENTMSILLTQFYKLHVTRPRRKRKIRKRKIR